MAPPLQKLGPEQRICPLPPFLGQDGRGGTAETRLVLGCLARAGKQSEVGRHRRQAGLLPFCGASVHVAGLLRGRYPGSAYIELHYTALSTFQVLLVPGT